MRRRKVPETLDQESSQREPRRPWVPAWAWAAVAMLVAFAAYTTVETRRLRTEGVALAHRIAQEQRRTRAIEDDRLRYLEALNIIAAPGTRQIQLAPAQTATAPITAYWNRQGGLVLAGDRLPQLASGRTLQLWVTSRQGLPSSVGIFRPNAAGQILFVLPAATALSGAKALTISEEPAGGSPQPTSTPGWAAPIAQAEGR